MFITSFSSTFALSLLTVSALAVPLEPRQDNVELIPGIERHDLCPAGMQYRAAGACTSNFTGCARPEDNETCSGVGFPSLYKACARPEYGTYRSCPNNGFYGCSVADVCNIPGPNFQATPTIPGVVRADLCPQDNIFKQPGECASGFVGCLPTGLDFICTFKAASPIFLGTCYYTPLGHYRTCDNGFFGCHPDESVCNAPTLQPPTSSSARPSTTPTSSITRTSSTVPSNTSSPPTTGLAKFCPTGTQYFASKTCSSGFVGCGTDAQCSGPTRFYWGDCPAGTGNFNVCAKSGFVGCTTLQNVC